MRKVRKIDRRYVAAGIGFGIGIGGCAGLLVEQFLLGVSVGMIVGVLVASIHELLKVKATDKEG